MEKISKEKMTASLVHLLPNAVAFAIHNVLVNFINVKYEQPLFGFVYMISASLISIILLKTTKQNDIFILENAKESVNHHISFLFIVAIQTVFFILLSPFYIQLNELIPQIVILIFACVKLLFTILALDFASNSNVFKFPMSYKFFK
jgi:uncharacterized Tic20 family protein